jgi:hypothetical protein
MDKRMQDDKDVESKDAPKQKPEDLDPEGLAKSIGHQLVDYQCKIWLGTAEKEWRKHEDELVVQLVTHLPKGARMLLAKAMAGSSHEEPEPQPSLKVADG